MSNFSVSLCETMILIAKASHTTFDVYNIFFPLFCLCVLPLLLFFYWLEWNKCAWVTKKAADRIDVDSLQRCATALTTIRRNFLFTHVNETKIDYIAFVCLNIVADTFWLFISPTEWLNGTNSRRQKAFKAVLTLNLLIDSKQYAKSYSFMHNGDKEMRLK